MPRPFASTVILTPDVRQSLDALTRAGSTPQALALRCNIVLLAAQHHQPTNQQIADALDCHRHTVATWRERFVLQGIPGLQDAPRSGRPRTFSPL